MRQKNEYIEIPEPSDLKLRPILAGPESATERLSHLIDILLQPLCPKILSYVRDDMDFLNVIPDTVPEITILTTSDVTSLYTNIPHDLGISAIRFWVEKERHMFAGRFHTEFIIEAIRIILEENTFNFDGKHTGKLKVLQWEQKVAFLRNTD